MIKRFWNWVLSFFRKKQTVVEKTPYAKRIVKPGQLVWECDLKTGDVVKAEIVELPWVDLKGRKRNIREVVMKKGCIYEIALNGENAVRKFEQRIIEISKKSKV
jgi:hypothetical protein